MKRPTKKPLQILTVLMLSAGALTSCIPDKPASKNSVTNRAVQAKVDDDALRAVSFARKAQTAVTASGAWKDRSLSVGTFAAIGIPLPQNMGEWTYNAAWCKEPDATPSSQTGPSTYQITDPATGQTYVAVIDPPMMGGSSPETVESVIVWPENFQTGSDPIMKSRATLMAQKIAVHLGSGSAGVMESGTVAISGQRPDGSAAYTPPTECGNLGIPEGAPVIIMTSVREDTGSTESANRQYNVKPCPAGQIGANITSQYTHTADGEDGEDAGTIVGDEESYSSLCIGAVTVPAVTPPVLNPYIPTPPPAPPPVTPPVVQECTAIPEVCGAYAAILGRLPERVGALFWAETLSSLLSQGYTRDQAVNIIYQRIYNSVEARARRGVSVSQAEIDLVRQQYIDYAASIGNPQNGFCVTGLSCSP